MRRSAAAAAAFLLLPLIPVAASGHLNPFVSQARSAPHPASHFGVQLFLTPDEQQFGQALLSDLRPASLPATDTVRRGGSVAAVLVFQGCTTNALGKCDVVADFSVVSPLGDNTSGGSGTLWSDAPIPGGLHLGNASIGLSFGDNDPAGRYLVVARVTDRVSGRQLTLNSPLTLDD